MNDVVRMNTFNRHDLVWLKLDAVKHAEYAGPTPMEPMRALSLLHRWVLCNYPLIVARQNDMPQGCLRVGLAEPASWGKRRLAFLVDLNDIERRQAGPLLGDIIHRLPSAWQAGAAELAASVKELGVPAHVYGSTALEVLTSLPCVTANSDLDVLFKPAGWAAAKALCVRLNQLRLTHPEFKVDGEVLNPAGDAVHWLELSQQRVQLLAKSNQVVRLIDLDEYRGAFHDVERSAA